MGLFSALSLLSNCFTFYIGCRNCWYELLKAKLDSGSPLFIQPDSPLAFLPLQDDLHDILCFFLNLSPSFDPRRSWVNFRILFKIRETCVLDFYRNQKVRAPSAGKWMFQGRGLNSWPRESDLAYGGVGDCSLAGTFPRGILQKETFKNEH